VQLSDLRFVAGIAGCIVLIVWSARHPSDWRPWFLSPWHDWSYRNELIIVGVAGIVLNAGAIYLGWH
jgi:hypothetical protein